MWQIDKLVAAETTTKPKSKVIRHDSVRLLPIGRPDTASTEPEGRDSEEPRYVLR